MSWGNFDDKFKEKITIFRTEYAFVYVYNNKYTIIHIEYNLCTGQHFGAIRGLGRKEFFIWYAAIVFKILQWIFVIS